MEAYTGGDLGPRPHVGVLYYDSIGDFVTITPLLRGLRERYPRVTIDYLSGERTRELEEASPLIDSRFSLFGSVDSLRRLPAYVHARESDAGPYDLVINCNFHSALPSVAAVLRPRYVAGRALQPDVRAEVPLPDTRIDALRSADWTRPGLLRSYSDILTSGYIGEIQCKLARVVTDYFRTEVPAAGVTGPVPDVLIGTGGKRRAKLWPLEHWRTFARSCAERGLAVGLVGARPADQHRYYHCDRLDEALLASTDVVDLRGRFTLPRVAGALRQARACVTVDNGIMHLAAGVGTPTVALFGSSPWWLWAPRSPSLYPLVAARHCPPCRDSGFTSEECAADPHACMPGIRPDAVLDALDHVIRPRPAGDACARR